MSTFVQKLFQVFFERFNCVCRVFMLSINERIFIFVIRSHISDTKGIRTRKHTVLWAGICTVHLTVCYYHVTHAFQSDSRPYSCLDVKEILARNKRDIWSLSDSNRIRTPNYLICERTIIDLAKWSVPMIELYCEYLSVRCIWLYVTYAFQNEFVLYSCLNVKEIRAWNRGNIGSLSDSDVIRTHNHLVRNPITRLIWNKYIANVT